MTNYELGRRIGITLILRECLRQLGYSPADDEDSEVIQAKYVVEREDVIAVLRRVCESHGDNNWDVHLHLGDVIEKHLERYLHADQETGKD